MSEYPTFILLKSDLSKHRELFEYGDWQRGKDKKDENSRKHSFNNQTVMEVLWKAYKSKPVKVGKCEIVLIRVEGTNFQKLLTKKMRELDIDFGEDY